MVKSYLKQIIEQSTKNTNIPKAFLEYMQEPTSSVTVKFPLKTEKGIETIIGHRVIHSNHHLPTKGGLRFSTETDIDTLGALASIISYKSALLKIPFGGAKGCVFIDPTKYTEDQKTLITRRFTVEMWKRSMISSATDIMNPDYGTNHKTMNVIRDTYKSLNINNNIDIDNVVVGKSQIFGGLELYNKSHGIGVAAAINYITENVTKNPQVPRFTGMDMKGHKKSVIIYGFGKTGFGAAELLIQSKYYKIIGVVEKDSAIYNPIGIKPDDVKAYFDKHGTLKGLDNSEQDPMDVLARKCDIVIVTTKEFSINEKIARRFDCKFVFEGSNIPITKEASDIMTENKIIIVPDLLAFCGGQICGYIEWLKNLEHRNLTMLFKRFESRVREQFVKLIVQEGSTKMKEKHYEGPTENDLVRSCIEEMCFNAFDKVILESNINKVDLRTSSYKIALQRIYNFYDDKKIL